MTSRRTFALSLLAASLGSACSSTPILSRMTSSHRTEARLDLDPAAFTRKDLIVNGRTVTVRAWEGLPTVARPVDPDCQAINLYVPEAYFQGGRIGRHDARSAPIFLPNQVGGYMPARPGTPEARLGPPPAPGTTAPASAIAVALSRGFVVAAPGARGRTLQASDGTWTGKAPAAIVDLKAAVRWLRHNAGRLPGDTERIVSNGTSAGGALSALLGASGNSTDHADELAAAGAASQRDDIFAVSAYCPITNLEHADAAYEWQFSGVDAYRRIDLSMLDYRVQRREVAGVLDARQIALSAELKTLFPDYVNALGLHDPAGRPLRLEADGSGSLLEQIKALVIASAQQAVDAGADLSDRPWLRLEGRRVRDLDFAAYVRAAGRMKLPPAFDGLALDSGENQLFGSATVDRRHFTDFSMRHDSGNGGARADARTVRMMNAMHYAGAPGATVSRHWRIRHGTMDRDTSLAIPVLLAAALRERGIGDVDLALPWDRPHSGDYDLPELFDWIEQRVAAG